ncbi:DNA-binding protein [Bordetella tumbae]|uniref:ATP-binding protein n=1 Tax=Bordetella tumbae TaxID=1649139 RepID=UPI0039EE9D29
MGVSGYSKDDFGKKVAMVVNAATPIRSVEHLKGRDQKLEEIQRALYAAGRHIFVYGDRGVGKSSLAATAAYQYQSSDAEPIFVSGSPDDTFQSIIANIAVQALGRSKVQSKNKRETASISFRGLQWSSTNEISATDLIGQVKSIGDASELLKQASAAHSDKPTVVLDEFDMIKNVDERAKFASLLKQLGDQSINLKFFITGVGPSCQELLGAHPSTHRQLATFELMRLGFEGRREIVQEAASAFDFELDDDVNWRIALISDGYPYYIHLIVEKMLWAAFDSNSDDPKLGWDEFHTGLRVAVEETNADLKKPYMKAVLYRPPELEDIVWSTADGDDLFRDSKSMFSSYEHVISKRLDRPTVDRSKYGDYLRKLRTTVYGSILKPIAGRSGWYEYSEKMLRGYVRMQAEANGVTLNGERAIPRQHMYIGNSRTGSYGPTIPKGVNQNRQVSEDT